MLLGAAGLLDLMLPRACVSCGGPMSEGIVCEICWLRLPVLRSPRCERCGHPTGEGPCTFCPLLPPFVRAARSVCWVPGGSAGAAVHALKYQGWTAVAPAMAERMARLAWPADVVAERRVVIPVPLSATRLRERGYNQAALLARPLARRWEIACLEGALERTRHTVTQTKLTPPERSTNVHGAFRVSDGAVARVAGAHVVLVDDVLTTGSTLNAAAGALFDAGARILSYVTFGRARTASD